MVWKSSLTFPKSESYLVILCDELLLFSLQKWVDPSKLLKKQFKGMSLTVKYECFEACVSAGAYACMYLLQY